MFHKIDSSLRGDVASELSSERPRNLIIPDTDYKTMFEKELRINSLPIGIESEEYSRSTGGPEGVNRRPSRWPFMCAYFVVMWSR